MTDETHFDAVVVGSGFGGSVTAFRLAEAGQRVCLLERGRTYPPGSFPRSPHGMRDNFWIPDEGRFGLYDFWSFHRIHALVASGLGGGSLIYANVLMRKDEKWFVTEDLERGGYEHWPITRAELEPHYDAVEQVLRPQRYPFDHVPYSTTSKTKAFAEAARALGMEPFLPKLAITFANDGEPPVPGEPIRDELPNLHGRTRQTCRLCGECDFGCNFGSKNTLDFNYLSAARRHGAELRTGCEVVAMEPRRGAPGYAVRYREHRTSGDSDERGPVVRVVTADRLILAAGTIGTTHLLLVSVFVLFFLAIRRTAVQTISALTSKIPGEPDNAFGLSSPVADIERFLASGEHPPMRRDPPGRQIGIFVSGHTHAPAISDSPKSGKSATVIVNSGCWLRQMRPLAAHFGGPPVFVSRFVQTHVRIHLADDAVHVELWEHPKPAPMNLRPAERLAVLGRLPAQPDPDAKPRVAASRRVLPEAG